MNPVVYFEIPVSDMGRARLFYERVFKVSLEVRDIDGNEMALFPQAEGQPGASGALARGSSYVPGKAGARVYFGVTDIAQTLQLAVSAGGQLNYPLTEVPEYGWVAEFIDVEGNCIALYSSQASPSGEA
jgi:predicted enzyme related to lactoylglutathione lyase